MTSTERLYTPELLSWAVKLAEFPLTGDFPLLGDARSVSCGSTLHLGCALDGQGMIERIGMRVAACAVGQASAAIFATSAVGHKADDIVGSLGQLEAWLAGEGGLPDWPHLHEIAAAREFPGRHGAILLPWKAASAALSNSGTSG